MSLLDEDRLAAIRRIEEKVYGGLHEGRRPKQLAEELFGLLRKAVERGSLIGGQLSRATAARELGTTTASTTFKTAMDRIAEELQRCRPDDPRDMPHDDDHLGVACVKAIIGEVTHLVFVRGPRASDRGDPRDSLLRLKAEFRPLSEEPRFPAPAQDDAQATRQNPSSSAAREPSDKGRPTLRRPSTPFITVAALVVVVTVLSSAGLRLLRSFPSSDRPYFVRSIPAETGSYYDAYGARISPDGNQIAFLARARSSGKRFLFVRTIDNEEAEPIEEKVGDYTPFFWSYDGSSLYFVTGGSLKRKRIGKHPIHSMASSVGGAPRGTVNRDGVVLLSSTTGILRVLPDGLVSPITTVNANELAHTAPYFLPDGVTFLFLSISQGSGDENVKTLCSGRLDTPHRIRRIGPISSRVEWNAGHLLYARNRALYARPWNLEKEAFAGPEVLVTRRVWSNASSDADFSVARNGLLIVKDVAYRSHLARIRPGAVPRLIHWNGQVTGMTAALDRELAVLASYEQTPGRTDLWIWDLANDARRALTSAGNNTSPVLDTSSEAVYYAANRGSFGSIYRMSIATGAPDLILEGDAVLRPRGISPDGEWLLYASYRNLDSDLYCINLRSGQILSIASSLKVMEGDTGRFSPDGTQVVYVSDVSGEQRIYVVGFPPDGTPARPIPVASGWRARWSKDGTKIYYLKGRGLFAYDVNSHAVDELFSAAADIVSMEPTSRGEFLVVIAPAEPANRIVSNWQDAVGRKD